MAAQSLIPDAAGILAGLERLRLSPRKRGRGGYQAHCPVCRRDELTFEDDGAFGCAAGCSRKAILAALSASGRAEIAPEVADPPMLKAALGYAADGWKIFPLRPGTKFPFKKEDQGGDGGHLLATSDPATIRAWWKEHPNANIGLHCRASGIFVVDQDVKPDDKTGEARDGIAAWKALAAKHDFEANGTRASITWSGGRQNFYQHPAEDLRNSQCKKGAWAGIDTRSNGYVVLPPSVVNGVAYRWEDETAPITPLPDAALALFNAEKTKRGAGCSKNAAAAVGKDDDLSAKSLLQLVQEDGFAQKHRSSQDEGPCPWCGGNDRFRIAHFGEGRDGTGKFACRQCGRHGDKIDWLVRWRSMSETDALAACGLTEDPYRKIVPKIGTTPPAAETGEDDGPQIVLAPMTAAKLQGEVFKPLVWRIPKYLPVGMGLFSSPPKHGKTSILVDEAVGLATGGDVLGQKVETCGALLLLLEDPWRRIQDRIRRLLGDKPWPGNLHILSMFDQVPLLHNGLEEWIADFLKAHPDVGFLGIDILNRIMPPRQRGANVYDADVKALRVLHEVTHHCQIASEILHHDAKKTADPDFVQNSSGSAGLAGTCDTIWNLRRGRGEGHALLQIVTREGDEHQIIVRRDPETYHWTVAPGRPEDLNASGARQEVLEVFMGAALYPNEVLNRLAGDDKQKRRNAERAFYRAAQDGALVRDSHGRYYVAAVQP